MSSERPSLPPGATEGTPRVLDRLRRHFEARRALYEAAPDEEIRRLEEELLDRKAKERATGQVDHLCRCLVGPRELEAYRNGLREYRPVATVRHWLTTDKTVCVLTGTSGLGKSVGAALALTHALRWRETFVHGLAPRPTRWLEWDHTRGLFVSSRLARDLPKHWAAKKEGLYHPCACGEHPGRLVTQETVRSVEWLVLDELGDLKDSTPAMDGALVELLLERTDKGRRTVITSNKSQAGLRAWMASDKLADRLARDALVTEFSGESLRRNTSGLRLAKGED